MNEAGERDGEVKDAPARDLLDIFDRPLAIRSISLTVLMALAALYTLYFARPFLIPLVVAITLQFLLAPFVRLLKRSAIPQSIGALVVLVGFLALALGSVYVLSGPAEFWADELPRLLKRGGDQLAAIKEPLEDVSDTADKIEEMIDIEGGDKTLIKVEASSTSSVMGTLVGEASSLAMSLVITVSLLYFLLATSDSFLRKLVTSLDKFRDKRLAVEVLRGIELEISRYVLTIVGINAVLGVAVGLAMMWLGLPNPALWGALAGVANFVPYIGGIFGCAVVTLVALATYDSLTQVMLAPLAYVTLNGLEGLVLTPLLLGRRFAMSPVIVFVWFLFWGWIWGIPGALLAIPMLVAVKILADRIPSLRLVSLMIER